MTAVAFSGAEIGGAAASLVAVARELEVYAAASDPTPSTSLAARIAAAVGREPAPTPPVLFWRALTQGSAAGAFGYLVASLRAALGIGRMFPAAVRVQAIALILTVALGLAGGGAALAAGAAGVIHALQPRPAPERPAVIDQSATPAPAPARDTPSTKPNDPKPNSGPGGGRGGSGDDGDDRDDESDDDGDGHDGDRSGRSTEDGSDDHDSSDSGSDRSGSLDDRSGSSSSGSGSSDEDEGSPDSDG
jgi:hypothetical protein